MTNRPSPPRPFDPYQVVGPMPPPRDLGTETRAAHRLLASGGWGLMASVLGPPGWLLLGVAQDRYLFVAFGPYLAYFGLVIGFGVAALAYHQSG